MIGRTFADSEDQVDQIAPVVILSYRTWQRRYGSDRAIVGKTMMLDRLPTTIIGVMPEQFDFFGDQVEFFLPLCLTRAQVESRVGGNTVIARLKPSVSIDEAQAELDALGVQLAKNDPVHHRGFGARVEALQRSATRSIGNAGQPSGDYGSILLMLQGAVAVVLLIACANVAGLLLARTTARRTEVALRQAIGASRWRILRQLLTETLPLAVLGAGMGMLLAWGGLRLFVRLAPSDFPRLQYVSIDLRVLSFTALIAFATAVAFAIVPALHASSTQFSDELKEASRGATAGLLRRRMRHILVVSQIALALLLLIGAGLLLHSFARAIGNDLGADPTNVLTFDFRLPARESYKQIAMYRGSGSLKSARSRPKRSNACSIGCGPFPACNRSRRRTHRRSGAPRLKSRSESKDEPTRHRPYRSPARRHFRRWSTWRSHAASSTRCGSRFGPAATSTIEIRQRRPSSPSSTRRWRDSSFRARIPSADTSASM